MANSLLPEPLAPSCRVSGDKELKESRREPQPSGGTPRELREKLLA